METLTFNGILSSDYGIYVIGNNDAEVPELDYESTDIPGVSRAFHQSNRRYRNKQVVYHCVCKQDAANKIPQFCGAMLGDGIYKRITDTIHTEYYKIGTFIGGTQPRFYGSKDVATFDLLFDCDPRKFLVGGDTFQNVTIGQDFELTNARPGLFFSPVFMVKGISLIQVRNYPTPGSYYTAYDILGIVDDAPTLYFDTETKYAYYSSNNRDAYISYIYMGTPMVSRGANDYKTSLRFVAQDGASSISASVAPREYIL